VSKETYWTRPLHYVHGAARDARTAAGGGPKSRTGAPFYANSDRPIVRTSYSDRLRLSDSEAVGVRGLHTHTPVPLGVRARPALGVRVRRSAPDKGSALWLRWGKACQQAFAETLGNSPAWGD
jgi:hypothetical protein